VIRHGFVLGRLAFDVLAPQLTVLVGKQHQTCAAHTACLVFRHQSNQVFAFVFSDDVE
jgi:hypothetical protein